MAQIRSRVVSGVTIFDITGKLLFGEGDYQLRDGIRTAAEGGAKKILLNLAETTYIDSSGLGAITTSYSTVKREGGAMKLHSLTHKLQDLLVITKLLEVFETYDNEKEAIASFK